MKGSRVDDWSVTFKYSNFVYNLFLSHKNYFLYGMHLIHFLGKLIRMYSWVNYSKDKNYRWNILESAYKLGTHSINSLSYILWEKSFFSDHTISCLLWVAGSYGNSILNSSDTWIFHIFVKHFAVSFLCPKLNLFFQRNL